MLFVKESVLSYGTFVSGSTKSKKNIKNSEKIHSNPAEKLGIFEELPEVLSEKASVNLLDNILDEISSEYSKKNDVTEKISEETVKSSEDNVEVIEEEEAEEEDPFPRSEIPSITDIMNAGEEKSAEENLAPVENNFTEEKPLSDSKTETTPKEIIDFSEENNLTEESVLDWEVPYYDDTENRGKNKISEKKFIPAEKKLKTEEISVKPEKIKERKEKIKKEKPVKVNKTVKESTDSKKSETEKDSKKIQKVKRPIGFVLIAIISIIVIVSLAMVTVIVSKTTTDDTIVTAETNNRTQNDRAASDCESRLSNVISSVEMFYYLVESSVNQDIEVDSTAKRFFEGNKDVGGVYFINSNKKFINYQFFSEREINTALFDSYISQEEEIIDSLVPGVSQINNTSPFFGTSSLMIFCTFQSGSVSEKAVVFISSEKLQENLSNNTINLSFIVNNKGEVLVHPDISIMKNGLNFSNHQVVSRMMESGSLNEQFTYVNNDEEQIIGAYKKISVAGCSVITEVHTEIILEGVKSTIRGNIYLTIAILAISIMVIWFFSSSLSTPLKTLTAVTNEINQGNFNTDLFNELSDNRKDEIGVLIKSTKAERKMLNAVTRLTNPAVTRAIVRDEIDMLPHFKDITIFFSDIRGFTAISDQFNKQYGKDSAGEIISFLNDYMARMVTCITITGGTVDKFEGDAIMAAWGVLRNDKLDFENLPDSDEEKLKLKAEHEAHVVEDALNSIRAGIAMRYSLAKYNKDAAEYTKNNPGKYKPVIRIGAGINTGRATVGFMGSEVYKLEHSSIGDDVNLASRTESSNKLCGTDMLITQNTYDILKYKYIRCEENNFTIAEENLKNEIVVEMIPVAFDVKGKGQQHFYGIVNMPSFDVLEFFKAENTEYANPDFKVDEDCLKTVGPEGPKTLNDVRELLGIPVPDFSKVNLNEEENKIKIS